MRSSVVTGFDVLLSSLRSSRACGPRVFHHGGFLIARHHDTAFTVLVIYHNDDLRQLQTCLPGWNIELIQLGPRRLAGWVSIALLPSMRVVRLHAGRSVVIRGTACSTSECLMLSSLKAKPARWLGQALDERHFAACSEDARVDIFVPSEATLCFIATKQLLEVTPRCVQLRTVRGECISSLLERVENIEKSVASGLSGHAIEEVLVAAIRAAIDASTIIAPALSTRSSRASAVIRACHFINARLARPLNIAELSRHCGVGVRTLEYGFRELYDTTPVGFIKSQRLTRTHDELTHADDLLAPISRIARHSGFTHMGQYAQDYRILFGESPSMTLQRTLRRLKERSCTDAMQADALPPGS